MERKFRGNEGSCGTGPSIDRALDEAWHFYPLPFAGSYIQNTFRLPSRQELLPLLIMSFQGIFLVLGLQNFAMKTASASTANWIIICSPAFVALLGWLFLKEKISLMGFAGLVISAIGVMVVLRLGTASGPKGSGIFRHRR